MTKAETLVEMLRRYNEAQEVLGRGEGGAGRVPMMPSTWTDSYRELERCLKLMRDERRSQWFHVTQRYIAATERVTDVGVRRKPNGRFELRLPPHSELSAGAPSIKGNTARVRLRVWSPMVREEKVRRGVEWLSRTYSGEPFLPREFMEEVAA